MILAAYLALLLGSSPSARAATFEGKTVSCSLALKNRDWSAVQRRAEDLFRRNLRDRLAKQPGKHSAVDIARRARLEAQRHIETLRRELHRACDGRRASLPEMI
jgi:hypothetical protein